MKKILVAVDFSSVSRKVVSFAVKIAELLNARLVILYVLHTSEFRYALEAGLYKEGMSTGDVETVTEKDLGKKFGKLMRGKSYKNMTTTISRGEPWVEIVKAAKKEKADMIIIGTRGRSATAGLLLGSTAQQLIRCAPCPVTVIR